MATMESKSRVLVVDDENAVRSSFDRVLSESGYTVNTASDGPSALSRLDAEPYDLVFVDLRMPGMDGMEVVKRIRTTQPGVQVVVVTGYGTETTMSEARDLGVFDFVPKPLAPSDLTDLAARALARKGEAASATSVQPEAVLRATPAPVPEPKEPRAPVPQERASFVETAVYLVRGSLFGLVYIIFLPFIGMAMLAWTLGQRLFSRGRSARTK